MNRNLKTVSIALSLCGLLMSSSVVHANNALQHQHVPSVNDVMQPLPVKLPAPTVGEPCLIDCSDDELRAFFDVPRAHQSQYKPSLEVPCENLLSLDEEPIYSELIDDEIGVAATAALRVDEDNYLVPTPPLPPRNSSEKNVYEDSEKNVYEEIPATSTLPLPTRLIPQGTPVTRKLKHYIATKAQELREQAVDGALWAGKSILKAGVWGAGKILNGAAYGVGKSVQWLWNRHKDSNIIDQERERVHNMVFDALAEGKTPLDQGSAFTAAWKGVTQKIEDPTQKPQWYSVSNCLPLTKPDRIEWLKKTPSTEKIVQGLVDRLSVATQANIIDKLVELADYKKRAYRSSVPFLRFSLPGLRDFLTQSARQKAAPYIESSLKPSWKDWLRAQTGFFASKDFNQRGQLAVDTANKLVQKGVFNPEFALDLQNMWGKEIVVDSSPFYSVEIRA